MQRMRRVPVPFPLICSTWPGWVPGRICGHAEGETTGESMRGAQQVAGEAGFTATMHAATPCPAPMQPCDENCKTG